MTTWQPAASLATLKKRAALLAYIRAFFSDRQVLEVDVPVLTAAAVTDPNIDSLSVSFHHRPSFNRYLITSPEFYMKRLLAAGAGDIYYLGHAFRADESGSKHHCEFTMLEWYRKGWTMQVLVDEVCALVSGLMAEPVRKTTYRQAFIAHAGIDPFSASLTELKQCANTHLSPAFDSEERDIWLDLLFSHIVEPALPGLVFVTQFPASQAALAQTVVDEQGHRVALRFELYINGIEIANGYQEEQDANVLLQRFYADQQLRAQRQQAVPEMDARFIAAMSAGLPCCAGVALGVDRLLMAMTGEKRISAVMPFFE